MWYRGRVVGELLRLEVDGCVRYEVTMKWVSTRTAVGVSMGVFI